MSEDGQVEKLKQEIQALKAELADREQDLETFKTELVKANTRLERIIGQVQNELKMTKAVQASLVPTEFPNISGFEFSTKFEPSYISGGDYFDIFEHDDRMKFGTVVSTSSGYGTSALLLTILLKMTGQLNAKRGQVPEAFVNNLIQEVEPNLSSDDAVQIFYACIDRRNIELSYCSVGSILCFHWSNSQKNLQGLQAGAPAISSGLKPSLESRKVALGARDRLVICTPGILSISNKQRETFGEERLYKAILRGADLGIHDARNEILYQAAKFADGQEYTQDVTVVLVEVKDKVIKLAR